MKKWHKWALGVAGAGAVAFGAGEIIVNQPMSDQEIYNTLVTAELSGTLAHFTANNSDDPIFQRISAQVAKRANDLHVEQKGNLYLAYRAAMVAQGTPIQPLNAEAASVNGQPIEVGPIEDQPVIP